MDDPQMDDPRTETRPRRADDFSLSNFLADWAVGWLTVFLFVTLPAAFGVGLYLLLGGQNVNWEILRRLAAVVATLAGFIGLWFAVDENGKSPEKVS